jgi:hypothetical protein
LRIEESVPLGVTPLRTAMESCTTPLLVMPQDTLRLLPIMDTDSTLSIILYTTTDSSSTTEELSTMDTEAISYDLSINPRSY